MESPNPCLICNPLSIGPHVCWWCYLGLTGILFCFVPGIERSRPAPLCLVAATLTAWATISDAHQCHKRRDVRSSRSWVTRLLWVKLCPIWQHIIYSQYCFTSIMTEMKLLGGIFRSSLCACCKVIYPVMMMMVQEYHDWLDLYLFKRNPFFFIWDQVSPSSTFGTVGSSLQVAATSPSVSVSTRGETPSPKWISLIGLVIYWCFLLLRG